MIIQSSDIFIIVSARTKKGVKEKIEELVSFGYPFVVICGEKYESPYVYYREKRGKFDAINYGARYIKEGTKIICLNDVDNKIFNFKKALNIITKNYAAMVFCKLKVRNGPQVYFNSMMNKIRKKLMITSSGDLVLIRKELFEKMLPLPPCKTEDNYMTFKCLELGYKLVYCEDCWVETEKTTSLKEEELYKTRTVTGLYQALSLTKGIPIIRAFYLILPFISPFLLLHGRRGFVWMKGIIVGFTYFLLGDRRGKF